MNLKRNIIFGSLSLAVLTLAGCGQRDAAVVSPSAPIVAVLATSSFQPSGVLEHGSREKKVVALTFDADMTPKMKQDLALGKVTSWYAEEVITILEKNQVPATLFLTGMWSEMYPEAVMAFAKSPLFELGNHTYDHGAFHTPCYGLGEVADKKAEITKTQQVIESLTGITPKYFRFPGGCSTESDVKLVSELGLQVVGWDDISGDAYIRDAAAPIITQTLKNAKNGSIIVFHLNGGRTAPQTVNVLQAIIDGLRERGFSFVKVGDL